MDIEIKTETRYRVDPNKINPILKDKNIPSGAKLVLFAILYRLGGKDYAFPSQQTIAGDIGLSVRMVRYHLKFLKDKDVLAWSRGVISPKTNKRVNVNKYDLSNILKERKTD